MTRIHILHLDYDKRDKSLQVQNYRNQSFKFKY